MTFEIIKHRGRVNKARLPESATIVQRQERIFVEEWGQFVPCAPYDEHFIYENPDKTPGKSSFMCTCGAAAIVVSPFKVYLFVCLNHATYGFHTTSQENKKDFDQKEVVVKRGRKWM